MTDARVRALLALLAEDQGSPRGAKRRLAARIGKSPAQVSQWLSGYRRIEEHTAREIERKAGKPPRWMDDVAAPAAGLAANEPAAPYAAAPTLAQALPVVLARLTQLRPYRQAQVLAALKAAMEPDAPLAEITADLLGWLK